MWYLAVLTAILVGLLLWAEWRQHALGIAVSKLAASTGFVACAWAAGASGSTYGKWILAALILSWIGDACLLSRRRLWFLAGLVAFLAAHVALAAAFWSRGVSSVRVVVAVVVLAVIAFFVVRWLFPRVETAMRPPVAAYVIAISVMVALGAGAYDGGLPILLVAPTMFFVSDLAVARDRFVERGVANRLVGLPLYYGAQLLFALSPTLLGSLGLT